MVSDASLHTPYTIIYTLHAGVRSKNWMLPPLLLGLSIFLLLSIKPQETYSLSSSSFFPKWRPSKAAVAHDLA
jgi:hypothetical protein